MTTLILQKFKKIKGISLYLLKRIFGFVFCYLRPKLLLQVLKLFRVFPAVKKIINWIDPNQIRKHFRYDKRSQFQKVTIDGCSLHVDINDHIGYRIFMFDNLFDSTLLNYSRHIGLKAGDVLLDIGANTGTVSIPVCVDSGCSVIAIEASTHLSYEFIKNSKLNDIDYRMINLGVGDEASVGIRNLSVVSGNRGCNSFVKGWNNSTGDKSEQVEMTTIDRLFSEKKIDHRVKLIKLDVEGYEANVLRGGINFWADVKAPIMMEYRRSLMTDLQAERLLAELSTFRIHALDGQGNYVEFDGRCDYENILLIPF